MWVVVRGVILSVTLAAARYLGLCLHFVPGVVNPNSVAYFAPAVLAGKWR